MKTAEQYKKLTIRESTKTAGVYETGHAGIYEMCKEDYPYIAGELEKEDYTGLLDCGCGTETCSLAHEPYGDASGQSDRAWRRCGVLSGPGSRVL